MSEAVARGAGGDADPRFLRARLEWNDRFHGLARGKRNWQIVASALLLSNIVLAVGLAWLSTQSSVTPYVVEVDRLGQVEAFGPAEQLRKTDERLIRYQLGMYLRDLRTVVSDAEAQKELLNRAYAFTRGPAVSFLNEHFTSDNPFAKARNERVAVEVRSILRISEHTWQLQWEETPQSLEGRQGTARGWQAVATVELDPPDTTSGILTNPLGLYVIEISWTPTL